MDTASLARSEEGTPMSGHTRIRWNVFKVGAAAALIAIAPGITPAVAGSQAPTTASDNVSVFASTPEPGHPFGIAVGDGQVYVSTSAGDFFADPANGGHLNSDDERIFAYDENGQLVDTTVIDTADNSDMGLFGLALDGNPGPKHQLFVADMNGRILTVGLGNHAGAPKVFSQVPADSGLAGDWMLSMWNDLAFDRTGNLYVPDDKPRIWRVSPDGTQLAMVTLDNAAYRIAVQDLSSGAVRVLSHGRLDESPSFAPNGATLIYSERDGERGVLATVSIDGLTGLRLKAPQGEVREPAWGPFSP